MMTYETTNNEKHMLNLTNEFDNHSGLEALDRYFRRRSRLARLQRWLRWWLRWWLR